MFLNIVFYNKPMNATIRQRILTRMFTHRLIGGKHRAVELIIRNLEPTDEAKEEFDNLARENIIILKPTGYGLHCSLNPNRVFDVKKELGIA